MAQKSKLNLKKILEFIGLTEAVDEEQASRPSRVERASYEEERFTPARRTARPDEGAHRSAAGAARYPREEARKTASAQSRAKTTSKELAATANRSRDIRASVGTMVYYMHGLNECSNVIKDLIEGYSILLNLEETDSAQMQRIVDTLAGASFALGAVIRKVSEKTYILAPRNVNVMTSDRYERRY